MTNNWARRLSDGVYLVALTAGTWHLIPGFWAIMSGVVALVCFAEAFIVWRHGS